MENVKFVSTASLESVARAVGSFNRSEIDAPPCTYQVGDLICDPAVPGIYYAVTRRLFHTASAGKPAGWYVFLEQAASPFQAPQAPG